jgi:aspartate/methionine/tyrosine aminotransferase
MAYYSPTYCGVGVADGTLRCAPTKPAHEAVAGSLSKLTGINGIRIGWLSTDSLSLYHKAREYVASTSCGISYPSQFIADQILRKVNLDDFYKESNDLLNCNKEQLNKLGCILGHQPIPKFGMFALFEIDDKLEALLQKASVKVMPGNLCGDVNRHSIRINLANSRELTKLMVNTIIRLDKK